MKNDFSLCTAESQHPNVYKHKNPCLIEDKFMLFIVNHIQYLIFKAIQIVFPTADFYSFEFPQVI